MIGANTRGSGVCVKPDKHVTLHQEGNTDHSLDGSMGILFGLVTTSSAV